MPSARKKQAGWSYTAGEKGANRVRVYIHRTGNLFVEYKRDGRKVRRSLGHRDLQRGKQEADMLAADLRLPDRRAAITLGELFDKYLREVTPTKGITSQKHDKTTLERFRAVLGLTMCAEELTHRDAKRYESVRRTGGDLRPRGVRKGEKQLPKHYPLRARSISYDIRVLKAVLTWGVGAGFLDRNPLLGYRVKEEGSPHRPVFTHPEYGALLAVADQLPWQFKVLLMLANETGHRLSALLHLQWKDVDFTSGCITWRGANDKIGHEHVTPMTEGAMEAFELARLHAPGIGSTRVIAGVTKGALGISHHLARDWMQRGQVLAGLPLVKGKGYHAFRRKFASELRDAPVRNLLDLGGWKDYGTVVKCYQAPSTEGMRAALANRKTLKA